MRTEDLSTLKINKLTQAQYDKALQEGRINENELYLTPDNIGVNGLPENAEFGKITLKKYNEGIYFEKNESEIYADEETDVLVIQCPGNVVLRKPQGDFKTIATLDDIASSGGSALDENGNLVFYDYNKGIVFDAYGTVPAIYLDIEDDRLAFDMAPKFNSGLYVGRLYNTITYVSPDYITRHVNETGVYHQYVFPDKSGTFVVTNDDGNISGNMIIEGKLIVYSDNGDIPNAPSTNDIDAKFYAQGISLYDNDAEREHYLYFPQKTGTLATTDDIDEAIGTFEATVLDPALDEINYRIDNLPSGGGELPTDPEFSSVSIVGGSLATTEIKPSGVKVDGGSLVGSASLGATGINFGANNEYTGLGFMNLQGSDPTMLVGNNQSVLCLYSSTKPWWIGANGEGGQLATMDDLGDINAILDILNGEVV